MKLKHNLNRSQRLGLDIDKHVAIAAGAGTGKTTVMALRYIEHLLNDVQRATINWNLALRLDPEYTDVRNILKALHENNLRNASVEGE